MFRLISVLSSRLLRFVGPSVVLVLGLFSWEQSATAGGGAENLFLLVNSRSDSSRMIANHYIALRKIPPCNVLSIDWAGSRETVKGSHFREKILEPALKAIDERQLSAQIDYLVYSSDFPWRIQLQPDYPEEKFPKSFMPIASTNGATFLFAYVMQKNKAIVMPNVNYYAPAVGANQVRCTQLMDTPSKGFRAQYAWSKGGVKTEDPRQGQRYLLSTMLGVTTGRGNRVDEVISYLQKSAGVDGKQPHGTFYFMRNKDIRSRTRHNCYDEAVVQLKALGARAEVKEGILPNGSRDVMGLMTGTSKFDLQTSEIQVIPGAICDNLTSYGGDLRAGVSQTPLTEFLRLGAAGASGTVWEPTAQQAKFPLASVQVHYRRGCSLAEAFYQSITGPYQLLIVGDPLCQPWATPPTVEVNLEPSQVVKGNFEIIPKVTPAIGRPVGTCAFFLDGRLIARRVPPGQSLTIDSTELPDGAHELRVVAANADSIESQGRTIVPFIVANRTVEVVWSVSPSEEVTRLDNLKIEAKCPSASTIRILVNDREVGQIPGESGKLDLAAGRIGPGPVHLRAEATGAEGEVMAVATPIRVRIE